MVVDNDALTSMLNDANTKLNDINTELFQLRKFIAGCEDIIIKPSEENPDVMEDIMDKKLGKKMTASRRQAEYGKLLADKTKLGL